MSPSFVYFKNGPEYLTKETDQIFIPLMRFLRQSLVSRRFFFNLMFPFLFFFFHLCLFGGICIQHSQVLVIYLTLAWWLECSPMARETGVQSQVESYQRLKKWYSLPPYLTLNIIRYGSGVKWSNPGKGEALSPAPWCSSYRKGSLRVTLDYCRYLYFTCNFLFLQAFWFFLNLVVLFLPFFPPLLIISSLSRSSFPHFIFTMWSAETVKSTRWQVLFNYLINTMLGLLAGIRWLFVFQSSKDFYAFNFPLIVLRTFVLLFFLFMAFYSSVILTFFLWLIFLLHA